MKEDPSEYILAQVLTNGSKSDQFLISPYNIQSRGEERML